MGQPLSLHALLKGEGKESKREEREHNTFSAETEKEIEKRLTNTVGGRELSTMKERLT